MTVEPRRRSARWLCRCSGAPRAVRPRGRPVAGPRAEPRAGPQSAVDRRSDEHRDHVGLAEGTARRGRRRGGLRDHPRRHSPLRHDDDPRPAPAGAGRRGRADQLEQMGRVGARVQRPVREQAARPRRRPQRLQPDLLGRALGRRGPDARRHRSDRGDSRSRRRHVGRQRRERRDQHRHQGRGRHAGRPRPRRRRALW